MLILTLRTDKPEAELGLYDDAIQRAYESWPAHRQLAETIHYKISQLLEGNGLQLSDIDGIGFYKGPGSFTGLRIGAAVVNTLASELPAAIVGTNGEQWLQDAVTRLINKHNETLIIPEYGAPPRTTVQKK